MTGILPNVSLALPVYIYDFLARLFQGDVAVVKWWGIKERVTLREAYRFVYSSDKDKITLGDYFAIFHFR